MIRKLNKFAVLMWPYIFATSDTAPYFFSSVINFIIKPFLVSLCSCSILLPLYYALGNREQTKVKSFLENFTLINVEGRYAMVWVVFFFTVAYSMFGHIMIYFYEEQRKQL